MKTDPPSATPAARWTVTAAGALVVLCLVTSCSPAGDTAPEASATARNATLTPAQRRRIRLYTVASSTFRETIETTGVVDFDNDQATSILAPFSGPVSRLLVSAGDKVTRGQPLAIVDSPDFAAAVSAYNKALAVARTDRKLADADKDLLLHEGVSQREGEQAQTDALNAEADRDAARQALMALDIDPRTAEMLRQGRPVARVQGVIRAPIAGTVAERLITQGQLLSAGSTPSFTIADLSRVWVMAQLSESQQSSVSLGDPAEIQASAAQAGFSGTVTNISAVVNPDTRAVLARVVVENPGERLKKQQYVRVGIKARQEKSGLLIPVSAVLRDDENLPFVYLALPGGDFERRRVNLGYRAGDQVDIPEGLRPGDQIVVDGGIFIQFMQNQ
jgi:membrane fusion protein, heavy metal efflux system